MTRRSIWIIAILWSTFYLLFAAAPSQAQITVPAQVNPYEPIVVQVAFKDIPAGARTRGAISISDAVWLPAGEADTYHIWAASGSHTVTAEGLWVLTRDVKVGDETLPVLVDFGSYRYTATFTVGTAPDPKPDPKPDPPPPPPGVRWALVVEESSQRTPSQANLWVALRKELPEQRLLIVDKDSAVPSLAKLLGSVSSDDRLPVLLVVQGDALVRKVRMPATVQAIKEELAR